MSELSDVCDRAATRIGGRSRARRADAGRARLPARVEAKLQELLSSEERPPVAHVLSALRAYCRRHGLPAPARATVYNAMRRVVPPWYRKADLPESIRRTLHNVGDPVPGAQVVFHAFNYGDTRALSYAAGMPWACLAQALNKPGWRPKSRALLRAIMAFRGI
jgi:hypothetical protein